MGAGGCTIQGGAIIKLARGSYLYPYGPVSSPDNGAYSVFTAVDDHTIGEKCSSTGLSGYYANPAIWLYYNNTSVTLNRVQIRNAQTAMRFDANPPNFYYHTLNKPWLIDCQTGFYYHSGQQYITVNNMTRGNVTTNVYPSTDAYRFTFNNTLDRTEVLVNDPTRDSGSPLARVQVEPSMVAFGQNVLVGYNDTADSVHTTGWSRSITLGTNFTDMGALGATGTGNHGDPVLGYSAGSGTVYFVANPPSTPLNQLMFYRSTDVGSNFTYVANCAPGFSANDKMDKPWMAVDRVNNQDCVYVAFINNPSGTPDHSRALYFSRSTDGGNTWQGGQSQLIDQFGTSTNAIVSFVTVASDHTVCLFYYRPEARAIFGFRSANEGATFSAMASLGGVTGKLFSVNSPNYPYPAEQVVYYLNIAQVSGQSSILRNICSLQAAVNPANSAYYYIVYPDQNATDNPTDYANIYLRYSTDSGANWSTNILVNDDGTAADQWNPALAIKPNGTQLFVGFDDRRLDPANSLRHTFGAVIDINLSNNGSLTVRANFQISASNFSHQVSNIESDYEAAAADSSGFFFSWGDHRDIISPTDTRMDSNIRFTKFPWPQ